MKLSPSMNVLTDMMLTLTRPSILCVSHQIIRKRRKNPVGSTVRYKMMNCKANLLALAATGSVYGDTGYYLLVVGHYKLVLLCTWW